MVELIKVQSELDPDTKAFLRNIEEIKSQGLKGSSGGQTSFGPERFIQTKKNSDGTESIAVMPIEGEDQPFDPSNLKLVNDEEVKLNEQAFEDSTAIDAFVGSLDKISASTALFLGVMGAIDLEDAANFSAAHSIRLHNAQKHAPEYMQEVMKALEKTEGILPTLGVLAKFPRAWPRMIFEQTANAAIPVAMRLGGGIAGGFAVPVIGAFPGMLAGAYAGNAFQETIFWVDQIMQERGIDPTDAKQVLGFLRDRELMDDVAKEAARKGLSQAAVATIFDMFTGRILSGSGKTLSSKAIRFTGGTALQTGGEGVEELTGQVAARGKFSGKDVALEAALGLGGGVANTAVISLFNQAVGKESIRKKETVKPKEEIKEEIIKPEKEVKEDAITSQKEKEEKAPEAKKIKDEKKESAKKIEDKHIKNIEADAEAFKVKGTISPHEKEIAGGLTGQEEFDNIVAIASNGFKAKLLALTSMDVVFDLMSKVTGTFKGAVITAFKKPLDIGQRNQTKHDLKIKNEYIALRDKLNLNDDRSKGRIGVWGALTQEGGRDRIISQLKNVIETPANAEKILSKFETKGLTENERTMFSFMRANLEKLKQPILEVMKEAYGKDFRFVKEYFPFMADFKAMEDSEIQDMFGQNAKLLELVQPDVRAKPPGKVQQGFTRERVGGELNIKINAEEIFLKYVDNATYLIHMGRDIERLRKLAKRKEYKAAVGTLGSDITKNWLDLMARRGGAQGSRITKLDWLRKNVGVAILGFKLATVMIQTTAIFDGAVRLGGYAFKGVHNVVLDAEWRAFIRDNFTEVHNRIGGDASIRELMDSDFGKTINKLRDVSVLGIRTVDGLIAAGIAAGAYEKIVTEKGGVVDFANPDIEAILEAELEVRITQGSGLFKDAPAGLTDGAFWGNASLDKAFFQFQTFVLSRWGQVTTAFGGSDKWHEPTALKVRLVSFLTLALIAETGLRMGAESIIAGAAAAASGDDPVEKALDTFIEEPFFEKLAMNTIQGVPIMGQVVSTAIYGNAPIPVVSLPIEAGKRFGFAWTAKTTDKRFLNLVQGVNLLAGVLGVAPGAVQVDQLLRKIIKEDKKSNKKTRTRRTRRTQNRRSR